MAKATLKQERNKVKIYINDVLHLVLKKKHLEGIMSYMEDATYFIEFSLKYKVVVCEYTSIELWKEILSLLDQNSIII